MSLLLIAGFLLVAVSSVLLLGAAVWKAKTRVLAVRLNATRAAITPPTYAIGELEGLPPPVQRYFRATLRDGQPLIAAVALAHAGTFNTSETTPAWRAFTSAQQVVTRRAGFLWDARIRMAPGVRVHVHDALVGGEGLLRAAVLGLVTVTEQHATPELAQGELLRFLAEAAWYPTALLPSQGVRWQPLGDLAARATLSDGATTVALDFTFDRDGNVLAARTASRYRMVRGVPIATPWRCTYGAHSERNGMTIPIESEVAWDLPEGTLAYWRGKITHIRHEFAV